MAGVIHGLGSLGEICLGNQRCMTIDESVENTVILLSQSSCISFGMSNQFRIFDISLGGLNVDR